MGNRGAAECSIHVQTCELPRESNTVFQLSTCVLLSTSVRIFGQFAPNPALSAPVRALPLRSTVVRFGKAAAPKLPAADEKQVVMTPDRPLLGNCALAKKMGGWRMKCVKKRTMVQETIKRIDI